MSILPKAQLRIHNTIILSVLHLSNFWVVQTDSFGVVDSWRIRRWDLRNRWSWNCIALNHLFRQRFGKSMNILAPANSSALLAPICVSNFIFVLKSVERVQIGALLRFKSLICAIVLFQAWSKFTALNARQQDFSPWTARSRSRKDLRADWCGTLTICTVNYSSFCHIFDDDTLTSYIIDPWHVLPYFEFLIELGFLVPFAARGEALAFFSPLFLLCGGSIMSRHSAAHISPSYRCLYIYSNISFFIISW